MERLKLLGTEVRRTQSRQVSRGLFELKIAGKNPQRVYFSYLPGQRIMVWQVGSKNTQNRDIEVAKARLEGYR